jgi:hypothetical protein
MERGEEEEAEHHYRNAKKILRLLEREQLVRPDGSFLASSKVSEMLKRVWYSYELASQMSHDGATFELAESAFWGIYRTRNYTLAQQCYHRLAVKGNSTAHQRLGFLYSQGLDVEINPAKVEIREFIIYGERGRERSVLDLMIMLCGIRIWE